MLPGLATAHQRHTDGQRLSSVHRACVEVAGSSTWLVDAPPVCSRRATEVLSQSQICGADVTPAESIRSRRSVGAVSEFQHEPAVIGADPRTAVQNRHAVAFLCQALDNLDDIPPYTEPRAP